MIKANDYVNQKKFEDAIKMTDKIIKIDPNFGPVYIVRDKALFELKRYKQSEESFQTALRLGLDDSDLRSLTEKYIDILESLRPDKTPPLRRRKIPIRQ